MNDIQIQKLFELLTTLAESTEALKLSQERLRATLDDLIATQGSDEDEDEPDEDVPDEDAEPPTAELPAELPAAELLALKGFTL